MCTESWGGQLLPGEVMLFSVHCVYFLWVRGYWSGVLQTLRRKEEGREVSSVGRKVARLTQPQWLVIGSLTLLLVQCFSPLSKQGLDSMEAGKQPLIAL